MALRALAPAKVNLCLFLGPVRADGLHELVSVVETLSLADEVELAPAPAGAAGDEVVCPGVEGPNLAARALAAFREATGWDAPPRRVSVRKRIPVAAGMGGGSADAAATLRLAAAEAGHDDARWLSELALGLGADVPAALRPGPALLTGAGENLRSLPALEPHGVLVLPSSQGLSTGEVFQRADELGLARSPDELSSLRDEAARTFAQPGRPLGALTVNDLEPAAVSLCPAIPEALAAARGAGADHAAVTGSGPTVVGWFRGPEGSDRAEAAAAGLRSRFPGACAAVPVEAGFAAVRVAGAGE